MKEEFFGFYEPTEKEIDKSWNEGTFIFDANALLNLYRYSTSTRNDFISALNKLKDRVFMPYQVGHEFHSNRTIVIETLNNSYNSLLNGIKELFEKSIKSHLNQFKRHPSIDIDSINKLLDEFIKKLAGELEKQKKNHPDFLVTDNVLENLTDIYKNKVGKQFSKDDLKKIFSEGKDRYEQQIPPGYKDLENKRKKGEQHIYGDLIIWKEIINYTIKEKKNVILVTDDRKEDWWTIDNGRTIRPREELIKEFFDLTKTRILIYNADNFLHYAKERKVVTKIKETSIKEVKEIRKTDETVISLGEMLSKGTPLSEYLKTYDKLSEISKFVPNNVISLANKNTLDYSKFTDTLYPSNILNSEVFKTANSISNIIKSASINPSILTATSISDYLKNKDKPITLTGTILDSENVIKKEDTNKGDDIDSTEKG